MPRIQTFQSKEIVRQPNVSPAVAAAPDRAQAEFGAAVSQVAGKAGNLFAEVRERELNAERTMKALEIERELKTDVDAFAETYRTRKDYDKFETDANEHLTDLRNKYAERIGQDPVLQVAFERSFTQSSIGLTSVARAKKYAVMTDRAVSAFEMGFEDTAQLYVDSTDPTQQEILRKNIEIAATTLAAEGLIKEEKAGDYVRAFDTRVKTVQRERKVEAREAKLAAKEQEREAQEQTEQKLVMDYVTGGLTISKVLGSNLEGSRKEHWISKIEERIKKREKADAAGEKWKTDPVVEAQLFAKITRDPESVTDEDIITAMGPKLTQNDAKGLIEYRKGRIEKKDDPFKSVQAVTAIKRLDDAQKSKLFNKQSKMENTKAWAESTVLLKRFIKNHPDEDPAAYVDTLLEPVKTGWVESMLDAARPGQPALEQTKEKRKQDLEAIAGPEPSKGEKPIAPQETRNIRGITYVKRDGKWYQQ